MRRNRLAPVLLAVAVSMFAGSAWAAGCDERCLGQHLDRYLAQLLRHDPAGLPFAKELVAIENGKPAQPGTGSWTGIKSLPVAGLRFADASTGQVVYFGATGLDDGTIGSLFLRLKVVAGRIAESELFTRGAYTAEGQETRGLLEPDILYVAEVPKERRVDRVALRAIVESYMEAISQHRGALVPTSERCDRYQAGRKWTNSYANPVERGGGTCQSSLDGLKGQAVANRRIPVVDERLGIAVGLFVIQHGERSPANSTNVAEVFKVVDRKIRSIEEFSFTGGYPPASGFPDEPSR